ncbi:MAG: cell division protein [Micrococcales bacterium 73-15]|uniref:FtsW/RodA/SpoVE family cell cycle protein n=1 Tax=Salana multivorans TaxID=120377 RepID=UPI00095B2B6E|nr:FtsW/RodA/SpoVE family cell cycle protein [Salana multivorans]OJX96879.1 MAG: cell division protein [Micrococcales bacterium 73-15]
MATITQVTPRRGRWTELALLVPALGLGVYAYLQVGLGVTGSPPADLATFAAVLGGIALAVHLVLRWRAPYADPVILPVVIALNGIGLAMIARVHLALQMRARPPAWDQDPSKQMMWIAVGAFAAIVVIVWLRDHRTLRRYTWTALVLGVVLLLMPMLPVIGREINGSRLWVGVGGFTLQPAELAKIAFAVFFAGYLVTHRDQLTLAGTKVLGLTLPRARDLGPVLLAWGISIGVLLMQKELGTSILLFGLFIAMLYVATERLSWVIIGVLLTIGGVLVIATQVGYVQARIDVWLHALEPAIYHRDPGGSGQIVSGLFGMANGGLMGTGWGEGFPYLTYSANADMIVPSLAEELGLTGVLAVLMLYVILVQRGLRAGLGVRDGFGKLLASGLAFTVALQCFVVVGGATRVIPLSGLTMPFLAAGGSSLLANWIILALLLRVSDAARRPGPDAAIGPLVIVGPASDAVEPAATTGRGRGTRGGQGSGAAGATT